VLRTLFSICSSTGSITSASSSTANPRLAAVLKPIKAVMALFCHDASTARVPAVPAPSTASVRLASTSSVPPSTGSIA